MMLIWEYAQFEYYYMFTQAKLKEKQRKKKEAESIGEEVLQLI